MSATLSTAATSHDEARLLQLAAPPPRELLPLLNRAAALAPLLVVLAVLPGLYAVHHRTFTEPHALWGLKALAGLTADDAGEFVDPSAAGPEQALRWHPPLGSWLTAAAMKLTGSSRPLVLLIVPYLATAGVVLMAWPVGRLIGGNRLGFLTALLLAFHGPLLAQAQTPAPVSLALLTAMVAVWGFAAHLQSTTAPVSPRLLVGGLGLGLCLLAGGPVALVVLAVLLLHVLGLRGESLARGRRPMLPPRLTWVGWPALRSLVVFALTGFAVGGWWLVLMGSRHGSPFLVHWLTLTYAGGVSSAFLDIAGDIRPALAFGARSAAEMFGLLVGLALLGLWRAGREAVAAADETRRRAAQFPLAWVLCAGVAWIGALWNRPAAVEAAALWQGFLLPPVALLAAIGADDLLRRRISVGAALSAAVLTLAGLAWTARETSMDGVDRSLLLWLAALGVGGAGVLVAWWFGLAPEPEGRKRAVLGVVVVTWLAAHAATGLESVRREAEPAALSGFRRALEAVDAAGDVDAVVLIADSPAPLRLHYTLRSLWPRAEWTSAATWTAAAESLARHRGQLGRAVVVEWSDREDRPPGGVSASPLSAPQYFEGRPLRAWLAATLE